MREMNIYMVGTDRHGEPCIFTYKVIKRRSSRWADTSHYYEVLEAHTDAYYEESDCIDLDEAGETKAAALEIYKRRSRSKINEYLGYIQQQVDNIKQAETLGVLTCQD